MAADERKVELGFEGGQVLSLRLASEQLAALRDALRNGEGWHRIETDDSEVDVDLGKVAFVRAAGDAHKVGF